MTELPLLSDAVALAGYLAAMLPEVTLRSAIVILVAWAVVALMARRSAAERHMVWVLTLAIVLAIPLLGAVAPRLAVPVANPSPFVFVTRALQETPIVRATRSATDSGARGPQPGTASAGSQPAPIAGAPGAGSQNAVSLRGTTLIEALLGFWAIGTALVLTRYGALHLRVRRYVRTLPLRDDAVLRAQVDSLRAAFGIRRGVTVRSSERDCSPWTWGWSRPCLIVPADFADLPESARRQVLMHELAHVRRHDHLIGILAQICCAVYWPHPLVWVAARGVRLESEKACDDRVLAAGESAAAYAEQLLQIANHVFRQRSRSVWIPAMAHRSSLSPRVRSILDPKNRRQAMSRSKSIFFAAAALALALPLASIQSTQSIAQESGAALGETEFLQLVQRGPAGSDELETIVEGYVARGSADAAADAMARFMIGEYGTPEEAGCEYCIEILSSEGTPRQHPRFDIVVAALGLIEQRAEQDGSGDVLLTSVLDNALGSGNRNAMLRASYFVMRAIQIGIDESQNLRVAQFLYEQGNPAEALELAQRLYGTEGSAYYQSDEARRWIPFLEGEVRRRETLTRMLMDSVSNTNAVTDGEYLPITKTPPVYPSSAAEQRLEGHVIVEFTVDTQGKPFGVTVVESSDSVFNESAIAAARQFRYAPRLIGGTAVAVPGVRNRIVYRLE